MSAWKKTLERIMSGQADANIAFNDACVLLGRAGYEARHRSGSHRVFTKAGCVSLNIQDRHGKLVTYQVRQIREALRTQSIQ